MHFKVILMYLIQSSSWNLGKQFKICTLMNIEDLNPNFWNQCTESFLSPLE